MIDLSAAWITGWTFARLQTTSSWPVPYSLSGLKRGHTDYKKTGKTFSLEFLECNLYSPFYFWLRIFSFRSSSINSFCGSSMNQVREGEGEVRIQTGYIVITGDWSQILY